MRRALAAVCVLAALVAAAATAAPPPPVEAQAYLVRGSPDGRVLAQRAASQRRPVASITKLMTVLVALEHADLDETVVVDARATGIGESTVVLQPGERLTVRELALAALVPSANDAAAALALHVGGGSLARFVELMNAKARALGLRDTTYRQPHGLDTPGHVSSARDAVRLLRAALRVPFIRRAVRLRHADIAGGRELVSTDDLLWLYAPHVGGKTGHTTRAGWSEVSQASLHGVTVYAAVLGSPSRERRNADLQALERWGLAQYRPVAAVDAKRTYARARVPYGRAALRIVAPRTIVRLVRVERPLVERVVAPSHVALPVRRGQRLGEVRVYDGRRLVASSPLVAASGIAEPGRLGKMRWYATRTVDHLFGLVGA